jgi:hypothetical protein
VRIALYGGGAVGARAARYLVAADELTSLLLADPDEAHLKDLQASLGPRADVIPLDTPAAELDVDVTVLTTPASRQPALALAALAAGQHVVATADGLPTVKELLDLGPLAAERGLSLVVGAGFTPGLSCLLARHAADQFDAVHEVHVARHGTGGPACARQHHAALRGWGLDWRDHVWVKRPPGSGRELTFFPDPLGGQDTYRAALPDAVLLRPAFTQAERITARLAATRRDRLTGGLPMLRRPHREGRIGGLRVEVRGTRGVVRDSVVLGAIDRPAVAAGTVAALAARWITQGKVESGAHGLATAVEPLAFLHELATAGVRAAVFEGAS